nr:MAG TPA: hypothetical protein [Caudoviricetes sp.]
MCYCCGSIFIIYNNFLFFTCSAKVICYIGIYFK